MPKVALADTLQEWEGLLAAAAEQGTGIPGLEERLAKLRAELERVRALDVLRQRLQADRQKATADLAAARDDGQELTRAIRGMLIAHFGTSWEGLVQFGVRPIRSGRRSRKAAARPSGATASSAPSDR
ncbi:MAG: hypothetical protein QOJ16_2886 [Acidobacteriota bacterium]|jgi:uncharacterized coiled-coil protein SlyX|nr:hypothetical protein [Acidobacteriota bacterium]